MALDPVLAEAIDRAVMFGQLSISGFISLAGDSTPGDVAVFHTGDLRMVESLAWSEG